jgi:hypothetical protein
MLATIDITPGWYINAAQLTHVACYPSLNNIIASSHTLMSNWITLMDDHWRIQGEASWAMAPS